MHKDAIPTSAAMPCTGLFFSLKVSKVLKVSYLLEFHNQKSRSGTDEYSLRLAPLNMQQCFYQNTKIILLNLVEKF